MCNQARVFFARHLTENSQQRKNALAELVFISRRFSPSLLIRTMLFLVMIAACQSSHRSQAADNHPLSPDVRQKLEQRYRQEIEDFSKRIAAEPDQVEWYSRRGDAWFFLGEIQKSVADYDHMIVLDPKQNASHWRRGIARFYAGDFSGAARQFESYHSFDDVDRENGIWRYFSQFKASGREVARNGLLKYRKDDREPFPSVYKLFSDATTGDEILKSIGAAELTASEREKRLFYAYLYVGLNDALEGRAEAARKHLHAATANTWGPSAGYGPHYMWHVGRLHYELLMRKKSDADQQKANDQ